MTATELLELLNTLQKGINPLTGNLHLNSVNALQEPKVSEKINALIKTVTALTDDDQVYITDDFIKSACSEIRTLGYEPSVPQLAKIFIGSRSIANRALKGLNCYNRFRGIYRREVIHTHLVQFARRFPEVLAETPAVAKKKARDPWLEVAFFREDTFNMLTPAKTDELNKAIADLGFQKPTDRLPEYMAKARQNHPRSYEPWTRDEQALLIEAMCYTNDLEVLKPIFGRGDRAVERMGQRMIYDSQQKARA